MHSLERPKPMLSIGLVRLDEAEAAFAKVRALRELATRMSTETTLTIEGPCGNATL